MQFSDLAGVRLISYNLPLYVHHFSFFSPLLKSVLKRDEIDHFMTGEDPDEREDYISMLESRFFFLAADARSTLRLSYA